MDDTLETTLKIKVDRQEVNDAMRSIERDLERGISARFAKAAGIGAGGAPVAASTATPAVEFQGATVAASSAFARAARGERAGAPRAISSGELGGGGDGDDVRSRALARRRTGALSPLAGLGSIRGFAADPAGSAIAATSSSIGAAFTRSAGLRAGASRAPDGSDGDGGGAAAGLGLLRYANPIGIATAVVGTVAGLGLSKSSEVGERFAKMAPDLAFSAMGGVFDRYRNPAGDYDVNRAAMRAALRENGALDFEQFASVSRQYAAAVGFRGAPEVDYLRLRNAGLSVEAIGGFVSNARLGVDNADPTRFAALARSGGLFGPAADRYLQMIAEHTQRLATKGIQIDQEDQLALLTAMRLTPGTGKTSVEREAMAMASVGDMVSDVQNELLGPHRAHARLRLMQRVLRGGGTYEDIVQRAESLSPGEAFMSVAAGGPLAMKAAMPSLSLARARELQGVSPDMIDLGRVMGFRELDRLDAPRDARDQRSLMGWAEVMALKDTATVANRGGQDSFRTQKLVSGDTERLVQDVGNIISQALNGLREGMEGLQGTFGRSVDETYLLRTEMEKLNERLRGYQ